MITIVIADDEKIIRAGLKKILSDSFGEVINIIEAKNGEEALEICKSNQPELVITDIRMPKVNGVELMKRLSTLQNKPAIIVLSGYDDFSYAKAAIQNGASSYLLKPVDKKELLNAVKSAISSYEKEEKKKNEQTLKSLVADGEVISKEIFNNCKFQNDFYCVSVVGENNFEKIESILSPVQSYCIEHKKNISTFLIPREAMYLLETDISISSFVIGVSTASNDFLNLKSMLNQSFISLLNSFFCDEHETENKKQNGIFTFDESNEENDFSSVEKKYEIFAGKIDISSSEVIQHDIKELFDFSKVKLQSRAFCLNYIYMKICNDLFIRCSSYIESDTYLMIKEMMIKNIMQSNSLKDWQNYVCDFSVYLSNIMKKNKSEYSYITEALKYIESHFTKNINMAMVANQVSTNYTWFSEKFKEQVGVNFNEYLKRLRLEEAKKLLESGCYKVYEVASRSGFGDVKYFMKTFRENTGMSPTNWKNKNSEQ